MKATGIVRRIDDLGRVVIPKEIRRTMRIREGDPLEIYTSRDGEVIFKKYSLLEGVEDLAGELCETLSRSVNRICAVTDRDTIVAVSGGGKRELMDRHLSQELEKILSARQNYRADPSSTPLPVTDHGEEFRVQAASPVLSEGDLLGAVLLIDKADAAPLSDTENTLIQTFSAFLGRHMEN